MSNCSMRTRDEVIEKNQIRMHQKNMGQDDQDRELGQIKRSMAQSTPQRLDTRKNPEAEAREGLLMMRQKKGLPKQQRVPHRPEMRMSQLLRGFEDRQLDRHMQTTRIG